RTDFVARLKRRNSFSDKYNFTGDLESWYIRYRSFRCWIVPFPLRDVGPVNTGSHYPYEDITVATLGHWPFSQRECITHSGVRYCYSFHQFILHKQNQITNCQSQECAKHLEEGVTIHYG